MKGARLRRLTGALLLVITPALACAQSLTGGGDTSRSGSSAPSTGSLNPNITPQLPGNLFSTGTATSSQTQYSPSMGAAAITPDAVLAMSTPDYPVSPGDVLILSYLQSVRTVSVPLIVENDFSINLGIFKTINARGMTFSDLRRKIQDTVSEAYPDSAPQLIMASLGIFPVALKGEVQQTGYIQAEGLTRMDALLKGNTMPYSSRYVEIRTPDGSERTYDLFLATRNGDFSQNPYVRPGDTVIVHRAQRIVKLQGAVLRPGTYELAEGDTLSTLMEAYGEGFSPQADRQSIRIERQGASLAGPPQSFFVDASHLTSDVHLEDGDTVFVPIKDNLKPIIFVEGAIVPPSSNPTPTMGPQGTTQQSIAGLTTANASFATSDYSPKAMSVMIVPFSPGDTLSYVFQQYRDLLLPTSDLEHGALIRDGKIQEINLLKVFYYWDQAGESDVVLEPNDRILIPFKQQFVSVAGAVLKPGSYPYVPGRSYSYYTALAGGVDQTKNIGGSPLITDKDGNKQGLSAPIQPEDQIVWSMNSPTIGLGPIIAILGGAASITTIIFDIIQLAK